MTAKKKVPPGLAVPRVFSVEGQHPFATVQWEMRTVDITAEDGTVVFQKTVECPTTWSNNAVKVVASKYLRRDETSIRQLISRVADTITDWGEAGGYFSGVLACEAFRGDLTWLLLHQHLAFNSPVWFNVGVEEKPQCSACFINSVDDSMSSILDLAKTEGMLFKWGSGAGSNLSKLRGSGELLRGGGTASGPVSFMRGLDAFAGAIKSGGKTRRAAKMVILNVDHPDIVDFVWCKAWEEKKAHALIDAGYDGSFNVRGGAYDSVSYQNANHSVRVTDDFMEAVQSNERVPLRARTDGKTIGMIHAQQLFRAMAQAAWECGDPGLQFDDAVNNWHTCAKTDRIYASNPCSEYMFLDDSACNLASLNLMKFVSTNYRRFGDSFEVHRFIAACEISILAQEILVGNAAYPTPEIEKNSHRFRPLGLGYANLGALLMAHGLPYDSSAARAVAATVTAIMTGAAYRQSARIAQHCGGPFDGYEENKESFTHVMETHQGAAELLPRAPFGDLAEELWEEVLAVGREFGYRNAQATVLAPTGTIAFMMDCDTTGIEPDIALVKTKKLVGGGTMKIVNGSVHQALRALGYSDAERITIAEYVLEHGRAEGAPGLQEEHLPVFDCAFATDGGRSISWCGHVEMMAAVQPFLSGAISKTVNLPQDASVEDVERVYTRAWQMDLKAIAVYRDGCKRSQPLSTVSKAPVAQAAGGAPATTSSRRKLPDERRSITKKFSIGGHDGYIHVGLYDDGTPGEIFVKMAKEGSTISGLVDSVAIATSIALQYGVPLELLADKFAHSRFEPAGFTGDPDQPIASSIVDYLFRWLLRRFAGAQEAAPAVPLPPVASAAPARAGSVQSDAPACSVCGSLTQRAGACYLCPNCGTSTGCG